MIMCRTRTGSKASARGMVTAELAVATLAAGVMLIMLSWGIFLISVQLRCMDSASEVARQIARGDDAAAAAARDRAPDGAGFELTKTSELVIVKVRVRVRPFAFRTGVAPTRRSGLTAVKLDAEARVVPEPGS
jgi:hypothetical protein